MNADRKPKGEGFLILEPPCFPIGARVKFKNSKESWGSDSSIPVGYEGWHHGIVESIGSCLFNGETEAVIELKMDETDYYKNVVVRMVNSWAKTRLSNE